VRGWPGWPGWRGWRGWWSCPFLGWRGIVVLVLELCRTQQSGSRDGTVDDWGEGRGKRQENQEDPEHELEGTLGARRRGRRESLLRAATTRQPASERASERLCRSDLPLSLLEHPFLRPAGGVGRGKKSSLALLTYHSTGHKHCSSTSYPLAGPWEPGLIGPALPKAGVPAGVHIFQGLAPSALGSEEEEEEKEEEGGLVIQRKKPPCLRPLAKPVATPRDNWGGSPQRRWLRLACCRPSGPSNLNI